MKRCGRGSSGAQKCDLEEVRNHRKWIKSGENGIAIKSALSATAKEIRSGIHDRLLRHPVTEFPDGTIAEVAYFTTRRTADEGLRHAIIDLASRWDEIFAEGNEAKNQIPDQEPAVKSGAANSPSSSSEARGREGKRKRPPKRSERKHGER